MEWTTFSVWKVRDKNELWKISWFGSIAYLHRGILWYYTILFYTFQNLHFTFTSQNIVLLFFLTWGDQLLIQWPIEIFLEILTLIDNRTDIIFAKECTLLTYQSIFFVGIFWFQRPFSILDDSSFLPRSVHGKGGLNSEFFSVWLRFPKKRYQITLLSSSF